MTDSLVALIDVGKTHTRLTLVDPRDGTEVRSNRHANTAVAATHGRELDVAGIERWLLEALRSSVEKHRIRWIVPVAHGAAAVLLSRDDRVLAAPDYEDPCFERIDDAYRAQRDAYADTLSPDLPLGLNLGRQLFFLQETQPRLFSQVTHVLLYPQYWAWRLTGVMATEVTSLGCHSDLWRPKEMIFSQLATRRRWNELFPPRKLANELLGPISPEIAASTGLDPQCQVACGIHDSNASYLKFLLGREQEPFTVVSSGTWTVVMANHVDLAVLREDQDMLASVDAFGSPVATARFMGGREYEAIAGADARGNLPAMINVIERQARALPAFASGGPFAGREGKLINADRLSGSERASVATLYLALVTEVLIAALGATGDVLVDGPLALNPLFGSLLAAFLKGRRVLLSAGDGGNAFAACFLAGFTGVEAQAMRAAPPSTMEHLEDYRALWRSETLR